MAPESGNSSGTSDSSSNTGSSSSGEGDTPEKPSSSQTMKSEGNEIDRPPLGLLPGDSEICSLETVSATQEGEREDGEVSDWCMNTTYTFIALWIMCALLQDAQLPCAP